MIYKTLKPTVQLRSDADDENNQKMRASQNYAANKALTLGILHLVIHISISHGQ
jgi:hypothetical protein